MRTKLLAAILLIIGLPFLFAQEAGVNVTAYNSIAYAGHVYPNGAYCTCGCPFPCVCEPEEVPLACGRSISQPAKSLADSESGQSIPLIMILLVMGALVYRIR